MTKLSEHIGSVITNTIFFQEIEKLFLIASFRMMRRLTRDVPNDIFRLRSAHAEGTISFLLREVPTRSFCIVDPF